MIIWLKEGSVLPWNPGPWSPKNKKATCPMKVGWASVCFLFPETTWAKWGSTGNPVFLSFRDWSSHWNEIRISGVSTSYSIQAFRRMPLDFLELENSILESETQMKREVPFNLLISFLYENLSRLEEDDSSTYANECEKSQNLLPFWDFGSPSPISICVFT